MENLGKLYRSIEVWLDESQRTVTRLFPDWRPFTQKGLPMLLRYCSCAEGGRQIRRLTKDYLVKFHIFKEITESRGRVEFGEGCGIDSHPVHYEENNIHLLKECGFTKENGYFIPEHKELGIKVVEGKAKVRPDGSGLTIVEDASLGGQFKVTDIAQNHFCTLSNRDGFTISYRRHLEALIGFCNRTDIRVDQHHHPIHDLPASLSRMLLVRIKDNQGEIFIGDLDNLQFYRK